MVSTIFKGSIDRKKKNSLISVYHLFRGSGSQRSDCHSNPLHAYQGNSKPKQNLLELSGLISFGHTPNDRSVTQCHGGFGSAFL